MTGKALCSESGGIVLETSVAYCSSEGIPVVV